jgi:hypothetical protein
VASFSPRQDVNIKQLVKKAPIINFVDSFMMYKSRSIICKFAYLEFMRGIIGMWNET